MAVKITITTSFCAQIRISCIVLTTPEKPQHFGSLIDRICCTSYIRTVPADVLNIVDNLAHASSFFHWHSCLRRIKRTVHYDTRQLVTGYAAEPLPLAYYMAICNGLLFGCTL